MLDLNSFSVLLIPIFKGLSCDCAKTPLFPKTPFVLAVNENSISERFKKSRLDLNRSEIEFSFTARTKGVFGNNGVFAQSHESPLKIGISRTENEFKSNIKNQLIWTREAWLKYTKLGAVESSLTAGMFPYQAGCGLAFGNAHFVGRQIPALYTEFFIDQFRPGIKADVNIPNKCLSGEIYFGFIN